MAIKPNLINSLNIGFDSSNPKHRRLFNRSVGAWAAAFGFAAGASVASASQEVIDTSVATIYNMAMDNQLAADPDLWDVVKTIDLKGLGARSLDHLARIGVDATKFPGDIFPGLKEGGAVAYMTDGLKSTITMGANDMAATGSLAAELAGNLLILGSIAIAGGAALAWGDKLRRKFFVKSSEEYFEHRKKLLVNGTAVRSDLDATRERAVDAYSRLLAFRDNGHEGHPTEMDIADARRIFAKTKLKGLFEEIENLVKQISDERNEEIRRAGNQGMDITTIGSREIRDIMREVVFGNMPDPEVVDPFDTMLRPTLEGEGEPDQGRGPGENGPQG